MASTKVYRGPGPADGVSALLGPLTAYFHRPSGRTHLLSPPMPELLTLLEGRTMSLDALADRLAQDYEMEADGEVAVILAKRLEELTGLGLVEKLASHDAA